MTKKVAEGYVMLNQFANEDNWKAHYKTTGPEIWNDTEGTVTHCSNGNHGHHNRYFKLLKEKNPAIQIVGAQPSDGSQIPGIRKWPQEYLPKYLMLIKLIESLKFQKKKQSHDQTFGARGRNFAGMSSGGSVATAVKIAEELDSGNCSHYL
jgi:cysteine synthase B